MIINTNTTAMSAARLLDQSTQALRKSLARLSSGSKIISPEDDAAGLAQSSKLANQSLRDRAANKVLENGISFLQTKDGFLQKVQKALDRMSELSMLALDVTKTDTDRSNYNTEFQNLIGYINDIGTKEFNGKSLFYSNYELVNAGGAITWAAAKAAAEAAGGHLATITSPGEQARIAQQLGGTVANNAWIGATDEASEGQFRWITGEAFLYANWNTGEPNNAGGNEDYVHLLNGTNGLWNDVPGALGDNIGYYLLEKPPELMINGDGDTIDLSTSGVPYLTDTVSSLTSARTALTNVKSAIEEIARQRGTVGALLTRVQAESEALSIKDENLDAAVSRIRDANVAIESTTYARQQILTQSGAAMLAQANLLPQSVLRLLG